jgi:hypothetical protein
MNSFLDAYTYAPLEVREFLNSDDFYSFLDEYIKKFELKEEKEIEFTYLLQDIAVRLIDENADLKEIIKERLGLNDTDAGSLAFHIKNKFLPLVNSVWQISQKREEREEKVIKTAPKEIADIIQKIKERPSPTKVLNLQKVIPPKTEEIKKIEEKKESAIDLSKVQPIKTEIPKKVIDINQTISWKPPKPKETGSASVIIIKKHEDKKQKEEGVIDLSNL